MSCSKRDGIIVFAKSEFTVMKRDREDRVGHIHLP